MYMGVILKPAIMTGDTNRAPHVYGGDPVETVELWPGDRGALHVYGGDPKRKLYGRGL